MSVKNVFSILNFLDPSPPICLCLSFSIQFFRLWFVRHCNLWGQKRRSDYFFLHYLFAFVISPQSNHFSYFLFHFDFSAFQTASVVKIKKTFIWFECEIRFDLFLFVNFLKYVTLTVNHFKILTRHQPKSTTGTEKYVFLPQTKFCHFFL